MTVSEAQKRASRNYVKKHVKSQTFCFYPKEKDIYEWLQQQDNKSGYIKDLIRKDMQENN